MKVACTKTEQKQDKSRMHIQDGRNYTQVIRKAKGIPSVLDSV